MTIDPTEPIDLTKVYRYTATLSCEVTFTVPGHAIVRVLDNWNDTGQPQARQPISEGGQGWQDTMYDLEDEEAVVRMLASMLGLRGDSLSQLDGWADVEDPTRTFTGNLDYTEVMSFDREEVRP